jgi:hypothetical protein
VVQGVAAASRTSRLRSAAWWLLPILGLVVIQTYLVFREPIFSPVDELEHTDYVRTIAETGRLPVYGSARIDPTLLAVYLHEYPGPFDTTHFNLPAVVYFDYEAVQFPVYYIAAAPVYVIFHRDARVAIYALRLQNVLYSAGLLLVLMLMLRWLFSARPEVAALAPLTFLMMPGVSLRHSQVTNQVLAALLLAALFALLLQKGKTSPRRQALAEGALLGIAVMTKITVLGAGPSVLAAWATRAGGIRPRLLPGAAGFAITMLPWLVWSLAVYHSPLPWVTTHLNVAICNCAPPNSAAVWNAFVRALWVNFILPFEWVGSSGACTPQCYAISPRTQLMKVGLVVAGVMTVAALGWALLALRRRGTDIWRPALLALLAIAGVVTGIIGLDVSLNRFWSTDLREVYVFAAPMVLLLGGLAARFDRRWVVLVLGAVVILWLVIDYQIYTSTNCAGCPPSYFRVP